MTWKCGKSCLVGWHVGETGEVSENLHAQSNWNSFSQVLGNWSGPDRSWSSCYFVSHHFYSQRQWGTCPPYCITFFTQHNTWYCTISDTLYNSRSARGKQWKYWQRLMDKFGTRWKKEYMPWNYDQYTALLLFSTELKAANVVLV